MAIVLGILKLSQVPKLILRKAPAAIGQHWEIDEEIYVGMWDYRISKDAMKYDVKFVDRNVRFDFDKGLKDCQATTDTGETVYLTKFQ